ncbi:nuclear transport factor 2 domain-containing protein [Thelonectria olida]|uniref:Nuclear transport factor 2 domain-containing protein n=1 Tax=Thelonectria olida TaxID=1576542 RepID=A0A9P8W9M6_9HYPO|nr:nuclear transport factor 2 domain-containing protein [Thelonectria olida]
MQLPVCAKQPSSHQRRSNRFLSLPSTPETIVYSPTSTMSLPDADTQIKASSEAADTFVSHFYQAINSKANLVSFYVNSSPRYGMKADISINGSVVATPEAYLQLLEAQGAGVNYEIESFDAHVMNPSFKFGAPENVYDGAKVERNGGRMSVVVTVMGRVKYGKDRDAPQKMFNETFVLAPNWDTMVRNSPRGLKRWLIMSQNFRAL